MPHYKIAPGPPGHFLLGSTRDIRHDPLLFGLEMARHYGDIFRIRLLFWPAYLVNHPDGVKHVLQENQRNYHKDLYPYRVLKPLLGQGLVTNDGEPWLQQRRLVQPAWVFGRKAIDNDEIGGYFIPANSMIVLSPSKPFVHIFTHSLRSAPYPF